MKIFGTDATTKYIFLTIDGKEYTIQFRDNVLRGVHDIHVRDEYGIADCKVRGKRPKARLQP